MGPMLAFFVGLTPLAVGFAALTVATGGFGKSPRRQRFQTWFQSRSQRIKALLFFGSWLMVGLLLALGSFWAWRFSTVPFMNPVYWIGWALSMAAFTYFTNASGLRTPKEPEDWLDWKTESDQSAAVEPH